MSNVEGFSGLHEFVGIRLLTNYAVLYNSIYVQRVFKYFTILDFFFKKILSEVTQYQNYLVGKANSEESHSFVNILFHFELIFVYHVGRGFHLVEKSWAYKMRVISSVEQFVDEAIAVETYLSALETTTGLSDLQKRQKVLMNS